MAEEYHENGPVGPDWKQEFSVKIAFTIGHFLSGFRGRVCEGLFHIAAARATCLAHHLPLGFDNLNNIS
jgi:hypothetical protein